jgi:splicing factor 3B subunit 3
MLTFYELDLGLNHVVRKWSEATDSRANMLVQGIDHFPLSPVNAS